MRLLACSIENFGRLHNVSYRFTDGLNVLNAPNGSGKTTLAAFLRAMLYGFPRTGPHSAVKNPRRRWEPWQGGVYGGSLEFEHGGVRYRVTRCFGPTAARDSFELLDLDRRSLCTRFGEDLGEALFGLDEPSFLRSACIAAPDLEAPGTGSVGARLSKLVDDTDDLNDYETAVRRLRELRAACQGERKNTGEIPVLRSELETLAARIFALEEQQPRLAETEAAIARTEAELEGKNAALRALRQALREASAAAAQEGLQRRGSELAAEAARLRTRLAELDAGWPNGYPTREVLSQARSALAEAAEAERTRLDQTLSASDAALLATERGLFDSPETVRQDIETCQALCVELEQTNARLTVEPLPRQTARRRMTPRVLVPLLCLVFGVLLTAAGIFFLRRAQALPGGLLLGGGAAGLLAFLLLDVQAALRRRQRDAARAERERQTAALMAQREALTGELDALLARYGAAEAGRSRAQCLLRLRKRFEAWQAARYRADDCEADGAAAAQRKRAAEDRLAAFFRQYALSGAEPEELLECAEEDLRLRASCLAQLEAAEERLAVFRRENPSLPAQTPEFGADPAPQAPAQDALAAQEAAAEQEVEDLQARLRAQRQLWERLREDAEALPDLLDRRAALRERLEQTERRRRLLDRTLDYLRQAKEQLAGSYVGLVEQRFRVYAARLLDGQPGVAELDSELTLTVREQGASREPACYSAGTAELLNLCMHLALADALFDRERPFLLLDDPFVNLDDANLRRVLALLRELAARYQILYFVCSRSRTGDAAE